MWKYIKEHKKKSSNMPCDNKVFYVGAYCGDENNLKRQDIRSNPAGTTKMDYIIHALKNCGKEVILFAIAPSKKGGYCPEEVIQKDIYEKRIYIPSLVIRIMGKNVVRGDLSCHFIKKYVRRDVKAGDVVIAYHSLLYKNVLIKLQHEIGFKLILEVEEIYHEVIKCNKNVETLENKMLRNADGYIFSTRNLNERINQRNLPMVVVNGNYLEEENIGNDIFHDGKCHCVYAGTLEASKGAILAIQTAKYLPKQYVVHILGYGSQQEICYVQTLINEVREESACEIRYDGMLRGKEYLEFLQSCQIGLCTQNLDASYNNTSFPSKILVYLANGLRVVCGNVATIRNSVVGNQLFYYNTASPMEVAACIEQIDLDSAYNSRQVLKKLDEETACEMKRLLYEICRC